MNTDKLLLMLENYLQLLQLQHSSDEQITEVKKMIWAIQQYPRLQRFLNNITFTNRR
jgi:hypothetical protein